MTLWATSDLHVGYEENRRRVAELHAEAGDWLILAGDIAESPAQFEWVLRTLAPRFARLIWTPGNHDLWTPRAYPPERRGEAHYRQLVEICRSHGVLTPEDPFALWPGDGRPVAIVPTFVLYDYSFRPDAVPRDHAVAWAAEAGVQCADEELLSPYPYATRDDWCRARVAFTEARLSALTEGARVVLVNHFPLRRDLAVLPRIPRFSLWCGTRATESWTARFPIDIVVSGHLHIRSSRVIDGVRFEEVSLGYPRQWIQSRGIRSYLRKIL
ncbi:MAG: metallophosphoesterase [Acidobacteria bacterium]|nr:metallophosphoesterase [Acidobacteriota bacterium]